MNRETLKEILIITSPVWTTLFICLIYILVR
jgi:hypothetical protein